MGASSCACLTCLSGGSCVPALPLEPATRADNTRGVVSLLVSEAARMRDLAWQMLECLGVRRDR